MKDANVFISHAWKYNFLDVMEAVRLHYNNDTSIVIWFDLFSVNEHTTSTQVRSFGWWSTTFKTAIKNIENVLVVLFPWDAPIPLTRSWCIFEIFCAISTRCNFEVTFTDNDRETLRNTGIDLIETLVSSIDAEKSESTKPEDGELVKRTIIKYSGGMASFNQSVKDKVRECYFNSMK
jgi:hypothetical protein